MLCGIYNCSGNPARELEAFPRLQRLAPGSELTMGGPLAIGGGPEPAVVSAEAENISCVMEGYLYDPDVLATAFGLEGVRGPELVARAYQRFGADMLATLRGRFSLVLWDTVRRQGILTCDLLATKQFFVWRGVGCLLFASELPELLSLLPSRPGVDAAAFTTWLSDGTCGDGQTLYEGVGRLGPGELIDLRAGSIRTRRYWRPRYVETIKAAPQDLADGLREELARSTRRRLSPRSTGVILSGGLDSSIVAAVASRCKSPEASLGTYSAVFPGSDYDESWKIRDLTAALGVQPAAFRIEPQGTVRLALEYARRWETPLMGVGALIDIRVMTEAVRDGAEVVLDGMAGDEVLGFARFLIADRLRRGRLLSALDLADHWPPGPPANRAQKTWLLKEMGVKGAAPYRVGQFIRARREPEVVGPDWLLPDRRKQQEQDRWTWKLGTSGPRWWRHLAYDLVESPHREVRLDYLRHRAVAAGAVNESPLYDVDLIDYCLRMPPELHYRSSLDRPLAREAMRGIIPDSVRLQTSKANFSSFFSSAMTEADAPAIEQLLGARDAELRAYVDMEWVRKGLGPAVAAGYGGIRWLGDLWRLAAGECWLRLQADPSSVPEMLARPEVLRPSLRKVALSD